MNPTARIAITDPDGLPRTSLEISCSANNAPISRRLSRANKISWRRKDSQSLATRSESPRPIVTARILSGHRPIARLFPMFVVTANFDAQTSSRESLRRKGERLRKFTREGLVSDDERELDDLGGCEMF